MTSLNENDVEVHDKLQKLKKQNQALGDSKHLRFL